MSPNTIRSYTRSAGLLIILILSSTVITNGENLSRYSPNDDGGCQSLTAQDPDVSNRIEDRNGCAGDVPILEPATMLTFGFALVGLGFAVRRYLRSK